MSAIVPRIAAGCSSRISILSHPKTLVARSFSSVTSCRFPFPVEGADRTSAPIAIRGRKVLNRNRVHLMLHQIATSTSTPVAFYSSSPLSPSPAAASEEKTNKEFAKISRLEDANPERIHGIEVNPESLGYGVMPGNLIYKTYKWSGNTRKIPLELAHGYFWMVTDLKKTNQKPTLSNERLIPEHEAQLFPTLEGLTTLDDLNNLVDIPLFFLERAHDLQTTKKKRQHGSALGGGKITLVAITFRDNGFKMMPTWTDPFEEAFASSPSESRVQTFPISITERWALYPIRNTVKRVMRNNTPPEKHASTLAYFGTKEVMDFRDILRMHNIMTSYVFLLDDLGRVRFAGSGEATEHESAMLVKFARELMREMDGAKATKASSKKRR